MVNNQKRSWCVVLALSFVTALTAASYQVGRWCVVADQEQKTVGIALAGNDTPLFTDVAARAWIDHADEPLITRQAVSLTATAAHDTLTLSFTMADGTVLAQSFCSDADGFLQVALAVSRRQETLRSNRLEPFYTTQVADVLPYNNQNRMLRVPWDNDAWVRFEQYAFSREMDAYNVTALFNGNSRQGLILGAIDHDTWKNIVHVKASNRNHIDELSLRSGFTSALTRDKRSHGDVVGDTLRSARFVITLTDDWRTGLESFTACCRRVAPQRSWDGGVPVGWNSWGVMQEKISYEGVIDVGDFLGGEIRQAGFGGRDGRLVMSLDSWWNDYLSEAQVRQFVAYCKQNNMTPGLYYTPFADFATWDHALTGSAYTSKDIWLRVDGEPLTLDGAYALDPTHPGTQAQMRQRILQFRRWGIEYLKCDFMSHGALEADSWYDTSVTTGLQAYNQGMALLQRMAGHDIYIDLSISPLFPYQYAHGRRICCDTYSRISETQYAMNALTMGWWLDGLYFANDPDHLVLHQRNANAAETAGENRARITSGVITGMMLCGDNFSDNVEYGYPEASREAARTFLTNPDINAIPQRCRSFRPVSGVTTAADGAGNLFYYRTDEETYVAVINYGNSSLSGRLPLSSIDTDDGEADTARELWTGTEAAITDGVLDYRVPSRDARLYRISRKTSAVNPPYHPGEACTDAMTAHTLLGQHIGASEARGIIIVNGKKQLKP